MGQQLQCAHIIITREYPSIEITTGVTDFLCSFCARRGLIQRQHNAIHPFSHAWSEFVLHHFCTHVYLCTRPAKHHIPTMLEMHLTLGIFSADASAARYTFYIINATESDGRFFIFCSLFSLVVCLLTSLGFCLRFSVVIVPRFG